MGADNTFGETNFNPEKTSIDVNSPQNYEAFCRHLKEYELVREKIRSLEGDIQRLKEKLKEYQ